MNVKNKKAAKTILKSVLCLAGTAYFMFVLVFGVYAASSAVLLEQYVMEDHACLFVKTDSANETAEVRIGTEIVEKAEVTGKDGSFPIVTWILVDNSLSISYADRTTIKQILTDLVAGRAANESFNLCTMDENLQILLKESQDYTELKRKIDEITYTNHTTFLTDMVEEVLKEEQNRKERLFVRVVVISDSGDENPDGITREELSQHLKDNNIPIYTLGCKSTNNSQSLKEMYALSRQTNGQNWVLSDLEDILVVTQALSGEELPLCVKFPIPEKLRDGSVRGIQLTFPDGTVIETQASMPFGDIVEESSSSVSVPVPKPVPEPPLEPEPEPQSNAVFIIVIAALAVLLFGGVVTFIIITLSRRKREKNRVKPVMSDTQENDKTDILGTSDDGSGNTMILVGTDRRLTLILTDKNNPNKYFEAPLRGKISVGRNPANQIVIDYDRSVSGRHCEVYVEGSSFKIRDLNSGNGTYLDGVRVADVADIANGSIIKLGRLEFVVKIR